MNLLDVVLYRLDLSQGISLLSFIGDIIFIHHISGSIGRAVASDTKDLRFEILYYINWIEKMKIKKKETGNGRILKIE